MEKGLRIVSSNINAFLCGHYNLPCVLSVEQYVLFLGALFLMNRGTTLRLFCYFTSNGLKILKEVAAFSGIQYFVFFVRDTHVSSIMSEPVVRLIFITFD